MDFYIYDNYSCICQRADLLAIAMINHYGVITAVHNLLLPRTEQSVG